MNNKPIFSRAAAPVLAMMVIALLGACDNTFGIFSSIQKEVKLDGTGLFYKAAVRNVVGDGTNYYAAMARIFTRKVSDTVGSNSWVVIPKSSFGITDPAKDYVCSGLAEGLAGPTPTVFAAISDMVSGELTGIFSTTDHGTTWVPLITTGIAATDRVQSIFFLNGTLFASVRRLVPPAGHAYDLVYSDTTQFLNAGAAVGLATPVIGGAWDGAAYWFAQAGGVYTGATPAGIAVDAASGTPPTTKTLRGIGIDPTVANPDIYVTTKDGMVYKHAFSGGAWTSKTVLSGVDISAVAVLPSATGQKLVFARLDTASYGYGEYDWAASTFTLGKNGVLVTNESNYSTTVSGKPVVSFYYDGAEKRLFVAGIASNLTGYGLHSDLWSGTAWGGWTAE